MKIFFLLLSIVILKSCSTVEVTKEIIKAGNSVKSSVEELISDEDSKEKSLESNDSENEIKVSENKEKLEFEKKIIDTEQKEGEDIVQAQQKTARINFMKKNITEINQIMGKSKLIREDGNTKILRYDSQTCRLFLFFNLKSDNNQNNVKYFEFRNNMGNLIESKQAVEQCYREFKLI